MKFQFFIGLFLFFSLAFAQKKNDSIVEFHQFKIDENRYTYDFQKKITSDSTVYQVLDSLKSIGYYTLHLDSIRGQKVFLNKGKMYRKMWIKNDTIFNQKDDWFAIQNLDSLTQSVQMKYAQKGFPFSEIKVSPLGYRNNEVQLQLELHLFPERKIDKIQVVGYEKLSKAYIKNHLGLKIGETYNEKQLIELSDRLSLNPLIEEEKPAQTLFNTDSTTVYLYVKKVRSNLFDGILGFGNDENGDFQLNGNVLIELNNNFNAMEKIRLNWIATADKSTTLDFNLRLPALFQTKFGSESSFNMYKKDSVYVNLKLEERLFYQLNLNANLGLNLSYENSNFVLDKHPDLALLYDDYDKTGMGLSYQYFLPSKNRLLEGRSKLFLSGKTLNKKSTEFLETTNAFLDHKSRQYEVGVDAFHLFQLHPQHLVKAKVEAFGLFGDDQKLALNELYRIGGFNSLRGFNEESISASVYGISSLEYRFMPNEDFYLSAFGDYGFVENSSMDSSQNIFGAGVGFSFLTQLGIFNLSYAVGKQNDMGFDFKNSKIHFGILTRF
ncbi:MAG TPA: BamA/TamA family outer membrane protein [Moheibacter sp.]|nr:BamA/TamA family outer membrane protein [Moheibacter sp.]